MVNFSVMLIGLCAAVPGLAVRATVAAGGAVTEVPGVVVSQGPCRDMKAARQECAPTAPQLSQINGVTNGSVVAHGSSLRFIIVSVDSVGRGKACGGDAYRVTVEGPVLLSGYVTDSHDGECYVCCEWGMG